MLFFEFPSHPGHTETLHVDKTKRRKWNSKGWMDVKCPQNGFESDSNGIDVLFFKQSKGSKELEISLKMLLQNLYFKDKSHHHILS